jgi:hypothetical protein
MELWREESAQQGSEQGGREFHEFGGNARHG